VETEDVAILIMLSPIIFVVYQLIRFYFRDRDEDYLFDPPCRDDHHDY